MRDELARRTRRGAGGLRLVALLAALAVGAVPAAAADSEASDAPTEEELADTLRAAADLLLPLGTASGPEPDIVAGRLAGLGPDVIPALFELMSNGFAGPGGEARRTAVHRAFARLPKPAVQAYLRSVATGDEAGLAPRLRAIDVIAAAGGKDGLALLLEVVDGISGRQFKSQAIAGRVRPALVGLLQAYPDGYRTLERGWEGHDPVLREIALDAIESIGRRASVRSLGRLLGRDEATDLGILRRLCRMPLTGPDELGDAALFELERLLEHQSAPVRRAAAHGVGRFRYVAAIDELAQRLEDEDRGVRRAAASSLGALTGLSLGEDEAVRWRAWIKDERAWRANEYPGLLAKLRKGETEVRLVTVRSLAQHRMHADAIWRDVATLLDADDAALRVAACRTLGSLRAAASLGRLVEALEDPAPEVVEAADAALVASTGRPSPGDAAAWTGLLDVDAGLWD